ncbi:ECF transporter S component [Streptococcus dentasini]
MNQKNKSRQVAQISLLLATMVVIEFISQMIFAAFPLPIKPSITSIPVIIASIIYGPKIGATLGGFMGIMSVVRNSIIILPTSYLFSPFAPDGNWRSLIIALLPRILIGIFPYFIYKVLSTRTGLFLSGLSGALTNTVFVFLGIYLLFSGVYSGNIQTLLAAVFTNNAIAEMLIAAVVTTATVPVLQRLKY